MRSLQASALLVAALVVADVQAGPGEQRCLDRLRAESSRIEREHAARAPSAQDRAAHQAWAASLHSALAQAAQRAEACSRSARAPMDGARVSALEACLARVDRDAKVRLKPWAGGSRADLDRVRALEAEWQEARIACQRGGQAR